MQKQLLYYGFDAERIEKVLFIAKNFGIETKEVKKEDLGQKVGTLFCLDGYAREDVEDIEAPNVEFIIFSDFDRKILQDYILALKNEDIVVPYKSVITDTSKDWQFYYLVDHIQDEHKVVQMFNELGKLIKKAQKQLDQEDNENLRDAMEYALSIREINGVEQEDIIPRYKKLKEALHE